MLSCFSGSLGADFALRLCLSVVLQEGERVLEKVLRAGAVKTRMLGVSTDALDRFCDGTKLYSCNAARFKRIVGTVEARNIPPEKIAQKAVRILKKKNPRFAYSINRNPLLLLLNALPKRLQLFAIKMILR